VEAQKKSQRKRLTESPYWKKFGKQYQKQLMVLPAILFLLIFSYYPMYGVILAFKNFKPSLGITGSPWVGLEHFKLFLESSYLPLVMWNTIKIGICNVLIVFPAPIIFSLFLNEVRSRKFSRVVQTVSYLPHFVSWVIVAGMVYNMLATGGLFNQIAIALGITNEPILFLAKDGLFLPIVVITAIWKEIGWESILYLAALASVDPQLEESAIIDGANRFHRMWYIYIPTISPTIVILFIFALSNLLNTNFDQVYLLQNDAIIEASETIDTYVFKVGLSQGQFDYGQAVALFKSVISLALLCIANLASNKVTSYGLW
jgi:putative aldouronate transport system permease protein